MPLGVEQKGPCGQGEVFDHSLDQTVLVMRTYSAKANCLQATLDLILEVLFCKRPLSAR